MLTKYTIVKFPRVFQYALYMLGYNREEVCEKHTNKLWLHKLPSLLDEAFFEKLADYTPLGPKPGEYPKYRLINAIEKNVEELKEDEVTDYSISYGHLLKWIKECVAIRKKDILVRKAKRQAAREEREGKLKEKEEWEKKRAEALKEMVADAEATYMADKKKEQEEAQKDVDEFENLEGVQAAQEIQPFEYNETALIAEWIEKNPPIEIPPEVVEEIDSDYDQTAA